jgi:hypothetical protein
MSDWSWDWIYGWDKIVQHLLQIGFSSGNAGISIQTKCVSYRVEIAGVDISYCFAGFFLSLCIHKAENRILAGVQVGWEISRWKGYDDTRLIPGRCFISFVLFLQNLYSFLGHLLFFFKSSLQAVLLRAKVAPRQMSTSPKWFE